MLQQIQFHAEIAAVAPTDVELESTAVIINKGKLQPLIAANGPVPSAIWIGNSIGISSHAQVHFVSDTNYVEREVVKRIAEIPGDHARAFARAIGFWRLRVIGIAEPPDRIELLPGGEAVEFGGYVDEGVNWRDGVGYGIF